ncbi:2'-5' RNA ligase family protein [Nocardia sp. CA-129566]|uniref:2'-5' RNA ligase family protein n=1 Tax=Nocardia sp. CA-129566 TaxID=3239976 RepID=UPI003D97B9B0
MIGIDGEDTRSGRQHVRTLRSHWTRPIGPRGYYWFLTFEKSPELRSLAKRCQGSIDFPFYDLTPPGSLHLTLDRISYFGEISPDQLSSIENSAVLACHSVMPFNITIDRLSGVRSAVAFDVSPAQRIDILRDVLRSATLSAYPDARLNSSKPHPPHITIAYANSDGVSAADAMAAVDRMNETIRGVDVKVAEALMVLLERRQRSYSWQVLSKISFAENGNPEISAD